MALVPNIDSNSTGLSFAIEASPKVLSAPTWRVLEPNSYGDFGGQNSLVARNPINNSRQRKKGVVVDLESMAEFETDLTYSRDELQHLWAATFMAAMRSKGSEAVTAVDIDGGNPDEYEVAATAGFLVGHLVKGSGFTNAANNGVNRVTVVTSNTSVEVATGALVAETPPAGARIDVVGYQGTTADLAIDASGTFPTLTSAGGIDFTTLDLIPGEFIYIGGDLTANKFATSANNGFKRIRSVATGAITLDKSDLTMVTDAGTGKDIQVFFGRVLKNEQAALIEKTFVQFERQLGQPDDSSSDTQAEYVTGALASEIELSIPSAEKVLVNWGFMGLDNELVDAATGVKAGTRQQLITEDAFNTSSDFSRIRLAAISSTDEAPTAMFTYASEITLTINNNVKANKAVSVLGGFGMTLGTFQVDAELMVYLSTIDALQSVKDNDSVTLDVAMVKANKGIVIDLPLCAMGDGRPDVSQDEAVMVPLNLEAAEASAVDASFTYTAMMVFFDYLPDAAG